MKRRSEPIETVGELVGRPSRIVEQAVDKTVEDGMDETVGGESQTVRAAAVQLEGVVGDVAENLNRLERLVTHAAERGARLVALPEFCTSPVPFRPEVHDTVLPRENTATALLRRLSRRHRVHLGGSMLVVDDGRIYNRYHLFEPDGTVHVHDKDLPTMWENAFYGPGADDGAFDTALGGVGAAMCWELIRSATVRRMRGRVDVAMTGTHWWTLPDNWGRITDRLLAAIGQYNRYLSENAPAEFARRLGAPVLQASHCGQFRSEFLLPGLTTTLPYDTRFVGATQIVDATGHTLAQRSMRQGSGLVLADVELGSRTPVVPLEDRFWIPELPIFLRAYWHQQNACARSYHRRVGRRAGIAAAERARAALAGATDDVLDHEGTAIGS